MKEYIKAGLFSLGFLILDQLSKYVFYNQSRLADWAIFHPAFNTGVSRSLQIPMILIILIALLALAGFIRAYQKKYIMILVFVFLVAGTLGNLGDRIILHGVRDFIAIGSRFPIFNFADIYLNVGVGLLIISQFFAGKHKQES